MDMLTQWLEWMPSLAPGLVVSLQLTGLSLLFGFPLGLLFAVMAASKVVPFQWISFLFVEVGRGLPALVLLYLVEGVLGLVSEVALRLLPHQATSAKPKTISAGMIVSFVFAFRT